MDDVRLASGTSKSQLYHYFADKTALVCAVVAFQERAVIGDRPFLDDLATLEGLRRWRDQVVRLNGQAATLGGCPVGGLVPETANDERSRQASAAAFESWRAYLADGLRRMQDSGELSPEADPDTLALGLLAALQGGLLMAQAHQSTDSARGFPGPRPARGRDADDAAPGGTHAAYGPGPVGRGGQRAAMPCAPAGRPPATGSAVSEPSSPTP